MDSKPYRKISLRAVFFWVTAGALIITIVAQTPEEGNYTESEGLLSSLVCSRRETDRSLSNILTFEDILTTSEWLEERYWALAVPLNILLDGARTVFSWVIAGALGALVSTLSVQTPEEGNITEFFNMK